MDEDGDKSFLFDFTFTWQFPKIVKKSKNMCKLQARLVQLKDKEIMAMNGMGKAAIKDIRKKQSVNIKELLIELVTNEITEISTREVVNVLGEPV